VSDTDVVCRHSKDAFKYVSTETSRLPPIVTSLFKGKTVVGFKFTEHFGDTWISIRDYLRSNNQEVGLTFITGLKTGFNERVDVFVTLPNESYEYHVGCLARKEVNKEILALCSKGQVKIRAKIVPKHKYLNDMVASYENWSIE